MLKEVSMSSIANTPKPPYYAVIFTSHRTEGDNGYGEMAAKMVELASRQPGFLGIESARQNVGITVSYWTDLDSIRRYMDNPHGSNGESPCISPEHIWDHLSFELFQTIYRLFYFYTGQNYIPLWNEREAL